MVSFFFPQKSLARLTCWGQIANPVVDFSDIPSFYNVRHIVAFLRNRESKPRRDRDVVEWVRDKYILGDLFAAPHDDNAVNDLKDVVNIMGDKDARMPGTAPLVAKYGDRVRIRFGNLSAMEHHPIHIHGLHWKVTQTDGGPIPESAQWPETTVLIAVGQTRTVEFIADNPGDWAMHCHMSHHTMNQMGHKAPNLIGVRTGDLNKRVNTFFSGYMTMGERGMAGMGDMGMKVPRNSLPMVGMQGKHDFIDMGGMFTVVKVRENLTSYDDPGWYENPPGTLASLASDDELQRDLRQIPDAKPMDKNMKMDHMNMDHMDMKHGG